MKTLNDKWLVETFTEENPELTEEIMSDVEEMISDLMYKYIQARGLDGLFKSETLCEIRDRIKTTIRKPVIAELLSKELKYKEQQENGELKKTLDAIKNKFYVEE